MHCDVVYIGSIEMCRGVGVWTQRAIKWPCCSIFCELESRRNSGESKLCTEPCQHCTANCKLNSSHPWVCKRCKFGFQTLQFRSLGRNNVRTYASFVLHKSLQRFVSHNTVNHADPNTAHAHRTVKSFNGQHSARGCNVFLHLHIFFVGTKH